MHLVSELFGSRCFVLPIMAAREHLDSGWPAKLFAINKMDKNHFCSIALQYLYPPLIRRCRGLKVRRAICRSFCTASYRGNLQFDTLSVSEDTGQRVVCPKPEVLNGTGVCPERPEDLNGYLRKYLRSITELCPSRILFF